MKRRAGLALFDEVVIDRKAPGAARDLRQALAYRQPQARLDRLKVAAKRYPDILAVQEELAFIKARIGRSGDVEVIDYALLALERAITLLDHSALLRPVQQAEQSRIQRVDAGKAGMLDEAQQAQVRSRYRQLVAAGEKHGALKVLAAEFDVSSRTISRTINKA